MILTTSIKTKQMKNHVMFKLVFLKKTALLLFLLLVILPAFSQQRNQDARMDAIESRRIAFLTEKMALTPDEARTFWPVYNEYNKNRDELTNEHRRKWSDAKVASLSNEEAGNYAEDLVIHMERAASIKREYHEKLKRILPAKKIALLYEAERDFNRLLFQEARRRGREGSGSGR
jgi:hypothetical protein